MSLEVALAANTAALEKVAGLLAEGNKVRAEALAGAASITSARTTKKKDEPKPPAEAAKPTAAEVKGTGSAALDAIVKELGGKVDVEALRKEFGGYLGVSDEAERTKRKANVSAILEKIGAKKATEIADEDRPRAVFWLRKFAKGETVDFKADLDDTPGAAAPAAEEGDDLL